MFKSLRGLSAMLIVTFVAGAFLVISTQHAAAAPAYSVTTSPVYEDVDATPGVPTTVTLHLTNNDTSPVQVSVKLDAFSANGSNGEANIEPIGSEDGSPSWVHFSQSTFTAQPGVPTPITMTVDLPKTASLGYYYAVLFEPTIPTPTTQDRNIIKGSNAVLVLVDTHSANEHRQIQISNFSVSKHLYQYLPATFGVTVRNNGNIYVAPTGDIFISRTSDFKKVIDTIDVNKAAGNVLPNSVRTFKANWSDGFPVYQTKMAGGQPVTKKGKPVQNLHWDFTQLNKFRFGKYYAHLIIVYNDGTRDIPVDSVVSFWVIPWKALLLLVVVLVLIGLGLFGVGRSAFRGLRNRRAKLVKRS